MATRQTTLFDQRQVQRTPTPDGPERLIIMTANGSAKAAETIYRVGGYVGMESMATRPPDFLPVAFVDWPFTKLEDHDFGTVWREHVHRVADEEPRLVVAPDVDGSLDPERVFELADELAEYAEIVVVVPKAIEPRAVPPRFRVGFPCQPRFGDPPWPLTAYLDCETVHLLGGSPNRHLEVLKYGVPVESVDTASPLRAAGFGSVWTAEGWREYDAGYYGSLERTYRNLRRELNRDRRLSWVKPRNRRLDCRITDLRERYCLGPDEEVPGYLHQDYRDYMS